MSTVILLKSVGSGCFSPWSAGAAWVAAAAFAWACVAWAWRAACTGDCDDGSDCGVLCWTGPCATACWTLCAASAVVWGIAFCTICAASIGTAAAACSAVGTFISIFSLRAVLVLIVVGVASASASSPSMAAIRFCISSRCCSANGSCSGWITRSLAPFSFFSSCIGAGAGATAAAFCCCAACMAAIAATWAFGNTLSAGLSVEFCAVICEYMDWIACKFACCITCSALGFTPAICRRTAFCARALWTVFGCGRLTCPGCRGITFGCIPVICWAAPCCIIGALCITGAVCNDTSCGAGIPLLTAPTTGCAYIAAGAVVGAWLKFADWSPFCGVAIGPCGASGADGASWLAGSTTVELVLATGVAGLLSRSLTAFAVSIFAWAFAFGASPSTSCTALMTSSMPTCDFTKCLAAPNASLRWRWSSLDSAVIMITLIFLVSGWERKMSSISKPEIFGIITSAMIKSGFSCTTTLSASSPSPASAML